MGIFADYSTETEAREALWKLMEYEDTELSPEERYKRKPGQLAARS